jgi:CheY-like chemotaxis protein
MQDDERAQMGRQHIFVINGSPDFLDVARELLQEEHYNVTTTNFVPQSFDQIAALDPALIILDLAVGVRAGWELLERLAHAARLRDIPTIVVSTDPRYLDAVQADPARYGAHRLLRKPFDLDDLLRAVNELIGPA